MSQENVEIVRAQYARSTNGERRASWVLSYFDPNCEYRPVEEVDASAATRPDGGHSVGSRLEQL